MPELNWFNDWLIDHLALHKKPQGLPDVSSDEGQATYEAWHDGIAGRPISPAGAAAASKRLVAEPARFKSEHFPRFLEYAVDATRAMSAGTASKHDLSTRDGAEHASRGCPRCGGMGLATVQYYNAQLAADNRMPALTAAYCVCALGRWIKGNHETRAKDVVRRIPDLADVIARRGSWCVHQSSDLDGEVPSLSVREMVGRIVAGAKVPAPAVPVPAVRRQAPVPVVPEGAPF